MTRLTSRSSPKKSAPSPAESSPGSEAVNLIAERRRELARCVANKGEFSSFCKLVGYRPHRAQSRVHRCQAPRRVVRWGRRAGKTLLAAYEAAFCLLQDGKRVWIVAPDHELTGRVWDEITRILCDEFGFEPTTRRDTPPRKLAFPWRTVCEGKSTEPNAQKSLVGAAVDLLVWDEVAKSPAEVWERKLHPNLADRHGRALLISTPEGYNHFYHFCQRGNRRDKDWRSFHAPSSVNPYLPREAIEEARRTYTPEAFAQEWEAKFTHFAGQVYAEFDESTHVTRLKYNADLPLALAFDFGVENPFVCLWLQFTPDDKLLIIDEYVRRGETTLINGECVLQQHQQRGYGPVAWAAADPSAKDARLTLRQHCGIPTTFRRLARRGRHTRERQAGIEQIRRLLRAENGGPRLLVDPRCVNTIREFNLYRYPQRHEGLNAPEDPEKTDDHCMDALRYAVAVWLARAPERERLKQKHNSIGPVRPARQRLLERLNGGGG